MIRRENSIDRSVVIIGELTVLGLRSCATLMRDIKVILLITCTFIAAILLGMSKFFIQWEC